VGLRYFKVIVQWRNFSAGVQYGLYWHISYPIRFSTTAIVAVANVVSSAYYDESPKNYYFRGGNEEYAEVINRHNHNIIVVGI